MMAAANDSYIAVNPLAVGDATFYIAIEKQWRCQLLPCVKDPVSDVIQWSKLESGLKESHHQVLHSVISYETTGT
jgi:hypothetical protein